MKINFDEKISRLHTHAEKYEARKTMFGKEDVEPFWVADMDLPTPSFVTEKMTSRLQHSMFGYTTSPDSLFSAIQWWWKTEHGVSIDREWIRLSPSVVTSISMAIQSVTKPGDGVAIFSPIYGPFFFATELNQRKVLDIPLLIEQGQYAIDFDLLERCFQKETPALLFLCSPHNPGGRVWSETELRRLVSLCHKYGVKIFSDEIHCDIVYAPNSHCSILSIEEAKDICMVAHSIGKTFNTSGLCASFVAIPNPSIRKAFGVAQDKSHCGAINLLAKVAMEAAFSPQGVEYKTLLTAYLKDNIERAVTELETIPGAKIMMPQATFLVWCDFRTLGNWPTIMKKLIHEANVALSGGTFFGPVGKGYFRLNCAHPKKPLLAAVERIVKTLTPLKE